jgi:hypothetical protein
VLELEALVVHFVGLGRGTPYYPPALVYTLTTTYFALLVYNHQLYSTSHTREDLYYSVIFEFSFSIFPFDLIVGSAYYAVLQPRACLFVLHRVISAATGTGPDPASPTFNFHL